MKMLYEGKIPLEFVEDGHIATEPIKKLMKTLYSGLDSEIKLAEALKKIQYNTKKYIVNNEIKENLKKMLNEIYDEKLRLRENVKTNDLISSDRLNLINDDKSIIFKLNDATDLLSLNDKKELEDNSNKKKKKPKNFHKSNKDEKEKQLIEMQNMKTPKLLKDEIILDDISEFGKKNDNMKNTNLNVKNNAKKRKSNKQDVLKEELKRPLVNNETLNKLREKYPEIIDIFEGDLDKFMNYCQELIDEMHNKENEFEFYKMHDQENNYDYNNEINDLSNMIIENIKNDGDLIKNKKIFYSNYETDKRFYINHLMEKYFDNENTDMKKIYKEHLEKLKINEKNKAKKNDLQFLSGLDFENSLKRGNGKLILKVIEFVLIILIFVFCYLLLNNVKIKELSIFNSKILETFDETDYCIDEFKRITTTSDLNSWMIDCYLPVIKTYLTTFTDLQKSSRNSIYIFHSDIQIQYREFKNCDNANNGSSNRTYNKFYKNCLDMNKFNDYNVNKYDALKDAGLKVIFNEKFTSGSIFDNLFFSRTCLDSYNLIKLDSKDTILKFEKFLNTFNDQVPTTTFRTQEEEFLIGNKESKEMLIIKNLIKDVANKRINEGKDKVSYIPSEYLFEKRISLAFADPKVSQINISVFFINQDIDKFGLVLFKYVANDSNISTSVNNYASDIYYPFHQQDSDKLTNNTFYSFVAIFLFMFALVCIAYLKLKLSFEYSRDLIKIRNSKREQNQEVDIGDDNNNTINKEKNDAYNDHNKGLKQNLIDEKFEKSNFENSSFKINNNESNEIKEFSKNDLQKNQYELNINNKTFEKAQLESIYKEKLWKILNKSFFLSWCWITFLYELLYRVIHIMNGTFDGFFHPYLILDLSKRDGFLFFNNNIRLLKAIQILFLSAHMIYVVFSYKKLTIIRKVFQKGLIIFYIVISIIILAISLIVYLILGNYLQEFNSLTVTFISLLGYSLGIESTDNIEFGNVSYLQDYILYLKILVYFIRLVVFNFSLIVMYTFYKKASTIQENKDKIKKETEKENEFNKIKYNRLKRWLEKKNS